MAAAKARPSSSSSSSSSSSLSPPGSSRFPPRRLERVGWFVAGTVLGVVCALNACAVVRGQCEACAGVRQREKPEVRVLLEETKSQLDEARSRLEVAVNSTKVAAAAPVVASATNRSRQLSASEFFVVGLVMHVERSHDYLSATLESLATSELSLSEAIVGSRARIVVFDASPSPSRQIVAARRAFAGSRLFDFVRPPDAVLQRSSAAKQSRDVARAIRATTRRYDFSYLLLLEDDWLACRGLLSSIVLALEAATRTFGDAVSAVRVSYGLNGVLVPRDGCDAFAAFALESSPRIPPDHALTRWAQQTGTLVTFRHNAFVHVGTQSSIGNSGARWNTACYELLFDWLEIQTEAFQIGSCAHDVISPCKPQTPNPKPQRKHKRFSCDIALQDFPAYLASHRLTACLRSSIQNSGTLIDRFLSRRRRRRRR